MTQHEFMKKYHHYRTTSKNHAKKEAEKANEEGVDNDYAVAINLGDLGWCLMLGSAVEFAEESGIIPTQED
jgi:predicted HD phosphohydrolase